MTGVGKELLGQLENMQCSGFGSGGDVGEMQHRTFPGWLAPHHIAPHSSLPLQFSLLHWWCYKTTIIFCIIEAVHCMGNNISK